MPTSVARLLTVVVVLVSATVATADETAQWLKQIEAKVQANFSAPPDAHADSRLLLQAWLLDIGHVWAIHTLEATGTRSYNVAARRAVLGAVPLPLLPDADGAAAPRVLTFEFRAGSVRLVEAARHAPAPPPSGADSDDLQIEPMPLRWPGRSSLRPRRSIDSAASARHYLTRTIECGPRVTGTEWVVFTSFGPLLVTSLAIRQKSMDPPGRAASK